MRGLVAIPALAILAGMLLALRAMPARGGRLSGRIEVASELIEDWWLAPSSASEG
jgi:hypothetical protein